MKKIAWMLGLATLGMILNQGEAAQACNTTETIAGIDFGSCQSVSFGNNPPSTQKFELRLASQLPVAIAQYNTKMAENYAQIAQTRQFVTAQTGWNKTQISYDRWIAATSIPSVQLSGNPVQVALFSPNIQCPTTQGQARYLGCGVQTRTGLEIARN
jgi:hypothetical protein